MRSRVLTIGAAGILFLLAAGTVLVLQVHVRASGLGASCGAPFDVISGRADWQTWYADDLRDPRPSANASLVRTEACPAAVNRRTALAGVLGAVGLIAGIAAVVLVARNRPPRAQPRPLQVLGAWVTGIGVALTLAGLVALIILLANPTAALYLYLERWEVAIIGLIILVPAVALAAGGRALMIVARTRDEPS